MKDNSAMIDALRSNGPDPELAAKLQLFGQFVGIWDVEIINYKADGSREVVPGEWHFGWVLEGRAIQDVWIAPKRSLRSQSKSVSGDYGATLRFFDPKIDAWRSTWIGPAKGYVFPFIARQIGDEIAWKAALNQTSEENGCSPTSRAKRLSGALSNPTMAGLRSKKFRRCQPGAQATKGRPQKIGNDI
jgi:hypothetical protein